jgi:alpha-L-fucosidase 2
MFNRQLPRLANIAKNHKKVGEMNTKQIKSITPATRWEDALPTGNGSIGIIAYGNICRDTLVFNHEALWFPAKQQQYASIAEFLPELREILKKGEYNFTEQFLNMMFHEKGVVLEQSKSSYHPACDLLIQTDANIPFSNYARTLDLSTGLITIGWNEHEASYSREYFVSRTNDMICIRIKSTKPRDYKVIIQPRPVVEENRAFRKNLTMGQIPIAFSTVIEGTTIAFTGKYQNGDNYGVFGKVTTADGSITIQSNSLVLSQISNAEIFFTIKPTGVSSETAKQELQNLEASKPQFQPILNAHIEEHRKLFDRVSFSLFDNCPNPVPPECEDLESLLLLTYKGQIPPALFELMFYFGRFLLICSSRPNGWPANLQGVWNGNYYPAWSSDYHNDENVQMCYWAALPGNLAETTLPYFDYYEACIPDCQRNAQVVFGCRGLYLPIAQTIKSFAPLYGGPWLNWTGGAGWMAQLFYDYWLFTRNDAFLRDHAIPYLKEVALFYEDFMFKGEDGKYVFSPSLSPENVPKIPGASLATINATMDIAIAKEIFTSLCDGCRHLGIEPENIKKWSQIIADLPAYQINEDGAMREWLWSGLKDNYEHRHMSHIYGLFPGFEISETNQPAIFKACKVALEKRQVVGQMSQSGWSLAHMANIYARLHDGERAFAVLCQMIRSCVGSNLFTYHNDWRNQGLTLHWDFMDRIFQIDANMGITATLIEMVLYSNRDEIAILPALPREWEKGSIKGLVARGCIIVDMEWDFSAKVVVVSFQTPFEQEKLIRFPFSIKLMTCEPKVTIDLTKFGDNYRQLLLPKNTRLSLKINY